MKKQLNMNWLECVYCHTQYERIRQGESILYSSKNGNLMLTFCLLILVYGHLYLIIILFPNTINSLSDTGKVVGEVFVSISIALVYPIISNTIGKQENFDRISESFFKMPENEQAKLARKGAAFFSLSMIFFPFVLFVSWLLR